MEKFSTNSNEKLEEAIGIAYHDENNETLMDVLNIILKSVKTGGVLYVPTKIKGTDKIKEEIEQGEIEELLENDSELDLELRGIILENGENVIVAFTSEEQEMDVENPFLMAFEMSELFQLVYDEGMYGIILNPWGVPYFINREIVIAMIAAYEKMQKDGEIVA